MASQSPLNADDPGEDYEASWKAINRLMHQGFSWSGNERNCFFLNRGAGKFSDLSALSGLDLPDDARGLAICDWDHDGDLDLWLTNRGAPRVRLLRNNLEGHHWIGLALQGTRCNRDAVGARVTLHAGGVARLQSVRAGHGFLSQSSTRLFFGLGEAEVERVDIRWPDGSSESLPGFERDRHYRVVQGTGRAERMDRPQSTLSARELVLPEPSERARVWMIDRIPFARVHLDEPGPAEPFALGGRPVLVNFWASWCAPCRAELQRWKAEAERFETAGLTVLALSTDDLPDNPAGNRKKAEKLLKQWKLPFQTGWVSARSLGVFEVFQQQAPGVKESMPLPCSFLFDEQGRVAAIYKGPVELDTLLDDLKHLDDPVAKRRERATTLRGRWGVDLAERPDPRPLAEALNEAGLWKVAGIYLSRCIELSRQPGSRLPSPDNLERAMEDIGPW